MKKILRFSRIEKEHLLKAWVAISVAFAIVLSGGISSLDFLMMFVVSMFTVGIGFLVHEIAHKYFAQKYHCIAEFRANDQMLLIAIVMAFFGFIFAAPGAVMIVGRLTKKQNGIVSLAGPMSNLVLALLFLTTHFIYPNIISIYGALINTFLGLFNLLPLPIFDGIKVYRWNKLVYFFSLALAGTMMIVVSKVYLLTSY